MARMSAVEPINEDLCNDVIDGLRRTYVSFPCWACYEIEYRVGSAVSVLVGAIIYVLRPSLRPVGQLQ